MLEPEELECPCQCEGCGAWVELEDLRAHPTSPRYGAYGTDLQFCRACERRVLEEEAPIES